MRALAAVAVGLALAAPAGALRTPDAAPAELLQGATIVLPDGAKPREAPQRLALRVLQDASAGARISFLQLYADGDALCAAHPDVACYASSFGRLWYVRLLTRTPARFAPPEPAAPVPQRSSTVVVVDGGRILRKPPTD
jgi:hypothetical protein